MLLTTFKVDSNKIENVFWMFFSNCNLAYYFLWITWHHVKNIFFNAQNELLRYLQTTNVFGGICVLINHKNGHKHILCAQRRGQTFYMVWTDHKIFLHMFHQQYLHSFTNWVVKPNKSTHKGSNPGSVNKHFCIIMIKNGTQSI